MVNQLLLKAFESTKGYLNKIIRGLYLFLKYKNQNIERVDLFDFNFNWGKRQ